MRKKLLVSALCMTAAMASAAPLTPEAALGRLAGENGPAKVRAIQSGAPVLHKKRRERPDGLCLRFAAGWIHGALRR